MFLDITILLLCFVIEKYFVILNVEKYLN